MKIADPDPSPPVQTIDSIARQWQVSSILNPAVLDQLHEINLVYLNMLALGTQAWIGDQPQLILPDPVSARLMQLDPAHRAEVARCPFSLFNARFHDGAFWASIGSAARLHDSAHAFREQDKRSGSVQFADMALFYAWHLVRSHALAAQLLLGMKSQTLAVLKKISLSRLKQLSSEHPDLVVPRWAERTRFWEVMLSAAQQDAKDRIAELRLLGIQMIAAELAASVTSYARL